MSAKAWLGALVAALALALALPQPGTAKTLKFANDGDVSSMDPYFLNETFLLGFLGNVYEPLVGRGKNLELIPKLAQSWEQGEPTVWRFHLRNSHQEYCATQGQFALRHLPYLPRFL